MTFRKKTTRGIGLALSLILFSGACAEARPVSAPRARGGSLMTVAGGYELQVLVDGVPAPTFFHGGESYVMGALGERYTLRVLNHTGRRIEAVASVDGRDVVDGRSADVSKRGYIVPAWGSVDIDGWRLSRAQVAAFRFSSVADSYAARTGTAREVGVIGVAVFPERYVPPPPPPRPLELPYDRYRSEAPTSPRDGAGRAEGRAKKSGVDDLAPAPSAPPVASAEAPAAASGAARDYAPSPSRRPGLGTEFGEAVGSSVREVTFLRANASSPSVVLGARYNDRDGLVALGIDVEPDTCDGDTWNCDRDLELRQTARPFPVSDRRYAAPPPCWSGNAGRDCR
ncbi:MAG TPA: hypothetical protein VHK47_20125 [Polyangia bacterium]|jgi:hypothetical protein|nr:hypothetical protein [Polyangia bacterium]